MDSIQREIDTTFFVKILGEYIEYSNFGNPTEGDKDAILRFLIYIMRKEGSQ